MVYYRPQKENSECLSDEVLTLWVERLLPLNDKVNVDNHLAGCAVCREILATIEEVKRASVKRGEPFVPDQFSHSARQIIKGAWETQITSVLLRITDGFYSAVETTGRVLLAPWLQPSVSLRADEQIRPSSVVVETIYKHLRCTVESSRTMEGRHTLEATFHAVNTELPIDPTVFYLFDGNEEIESQLSLEGKVAFEDLPPGSYRLVMNLPDGSQGHLDFHLIPS